MNFGMITLNHNINGVAFKTNQNYATWILITVIDIKTKNLYEYIANDFENGLADLTMMKMIKDGFQQAKTKK